MGLRCPLEPPVSAHSRPPLALAATAPPPHCGTLGTAPLQGIHGTPSTGGVARLGSWLGQAVGARERGAPEGKAHRFVQTAQHTPAGLECSHQPAAQGGFPREQLHLAPGHGNYC